VCFLPGTAGTKAQWDFANFLQSCGHSGTCPVLPISGHGQSSHGLFNMAIFSCLYSVIIAFHSNSMAAN
jgi:hypothetical protein